MMRFLINKLPASDLNILLSDLKLEDNFSIILKRSKVKQEVRKDREKLQELTRLVN